MVVWLMGISGAGKTTLGRRLKAWLDSRGKRSFIIDGDQVRKFFDHDLGYSREDRIANIKRILLAADVLSRSGVIAVVCNIMPFEQLRQFARAKVHDYVQVYLKKDITASRDEDVKKMYSGNVGWTPVVGVDIAFEEPEGSDLTIETDRTGVDQSFDRIVAYLRKRFPGEFN